MVTTRKVEKGTLLTATKGYCYNSSNRKAEAHLFLVNTFPDGEEALMSTQVRCIFDAIQKLKNNPQVNENLIYLFLPKLKMPAQLGWNQENEKIFLKFLIMCFYLFNKLFV
jgi:hypothetical protein